MDLMLGQTIRKPVYALQNAPGFRVSRQNKLTSAKAFQNKATHSGLSQPQWKRFVFPVSYLNVRSCSEQDQICVLEANREK